MSIKSNLTSSYKTTDICIWSLLELLEHVELITYLVAFEFYTPHIGVLKGAAAFLLTLFSISLTYMLYKSLPQNCKSTDKDRWLHY